MNCRVIEELCEGGVAEKLNYPIWIKRWWEIPT